MLNVHQMTRLFGTVLTSGLLVAMASGLAGCRGQRTEKPPHQFLPDMDDSPKWKPQAESRFFADGRTMRPVPEGTVAYGWRSEAGHVDGGMPADFSERADFLREDAAYYLGRDAENGFINTIPAAITVDREFILRGQERFEIYCSVCHGLNAEGGYADADRGQRPPSSAMVGKRWSTVVPSFHDPKYKDPALRTGKDGYLFDVIRNGLWTTQEDHTGTQTMPAYAHAVDAHDAWAIVAYIRTLQAMQTTDLDSIPPERMPNESQRPAPAGAETTPDAAENMQ